MKSISRPVLPLLFLFTACAPERIVFQTLTSYSIEYDDFSIQLPRGSGWFILQSDVPSQHLLLVKPDFDHFADIHELKYEDKSALIATPIKSIDNSNVSKFYSAQLRFFTSPIPPQYKHLPDSQFTEAYIQEDLRFHRAGGVLIPGLLITPTRFALDNKPFVFEGYHSQTTIGFELLSVCAILQTKQGKKNFIVNLWSREPIQRVQSVVGRMLQSIQIE